MVYKCSKSNGRITKDVCKFLSNPKESIEIKVAAINALGWNSKGQNNAPAFINYLVSMHIYQDKNNFFKNGNKEDLLIYAYLLAMDNYFDVSASVKICNTPILANDQSKCVQLISALIKSQAVLYKSYCDVYSIMMKADENKNLKNDIKKEAIQAIFKYINGYKKYCSNKIRPNLYYSRFECYTFSSSLDF